MNDLRPVRAALLAAGLGVLLGCGCRRSDTALRIDSYRNPSVPKTYRVRFAQTCYDRDAAGDLRFAAHTRSTLPDDPDAGRVDQYLWLRLTWVPIPGKTYDNPTAINCLIEYLIRTPTGQARYSGAGYAYPYRQRFSDAIRLSIERADLHLESRTGNVPDLLGNARLTGTLIARPDPATCTDIRRQMQIEPLTPQGEPPSTP